MDETDRLMASMARFYDAEARYSACRSAAGREALLATVHPAIVLHQPESLPYGGRWTGREGFGRWLDAFVGAWASITPVGAVARSWGEDTLISTVTMRATARSTGVEIEMPMCQIISFSEGLPVEWRNFAWDTSRMLDALRGDS